VQFKAGEVFHYGGDISKSQAETLIDKQTGERPIVGATDSRAADAGRRAKKKEGSPVSEKKKNKTEAPKDGEQEVSLSESGAAGEDPAEANQSS